MSRITPYTLLEAGTKVRVDGKYGVVVSSKMSPAYPDGMIAVNTIKFTHKYDTKRSVSTGKLSTILVPLKKEVTHGVNYSFIEVLS